MTTAEWQQCISNQQTVDIPWSNQATTSTDAKQSTPFSFTDVGSGDIVVVLISGLGGTKSAWYRCIPEIAKFTRVIAFDRLQRLGPDPEVPATAKQIAGELHTFLQHHLEAKVLQSRHLLLVAQSYGGIIARMYAAEYNDDVAGMLLIDTSHEKQMQRLKLSWEVFERCSSGVDELPPEEAAVHPVTLANVTCASHNDLVEVIKLERRSDVVKEMMAEAKSIGQSASELAALQQLDGKSYPLTHRPVTILSAARSNVQSMIDAMLPTITDAGDRKALTSHANIHDVWMQMQRELCNLSTNSRQITAADNAGHNMQLSHPEQVVAEVERLVETLQLSASY